MAKILLDEPCYGLADYPSRRGYPTENVKRGQPDEEIVNHAKTEKYIVVTKDRKLNRRCEEADVPCVCLAKIEVEVEHIHNFIVKQKASKEYF